MQASVSLDSNSVRPGELVFGMANGTGHGMSVYATVRFTRKMIQMIKESMIFQPLFLQANLTVMPLTECHEQIIKLAEYKTSKKLRMVYGTV
jgi:hypothetical protein